MSLWWALPVLVLVAGATLAAVAARRLSDDLGRLHGSLRRAGRVGVAVHDLRHDVSVLGRRLDRLRVGRSGAGAPAPGPEGPAR